MDGKFSISKNIGAKIEESHLPNRVTIIIPLSMMHDDNNTDSEESAQHVFTSVTKRCNHLLVMDEVLFYANSEYHIRSLFRYVA